MAVVTCKGGGWWLVVGAIPTLSSELRQSISRSWTVKLVMAVDVAVAAAAAAVSTVRWVPVRYGSRSRCGRHSRRPKTKTKANTREDRYTAMLVFSWNAWL